MVSLRYTKPFISAAFALTAALCLNACSFSQSSGSASDSAGSIAKSSESISDSSKSSSGDDKKDNKPDDNRYESEVQDFTVTYFRANATIADKNSFMKSISDLASQNGIVDWEANPKTYRAIGSGLRKARISGTQYDGYKKQLSDGDKGKMDDIQDGYDK